jgi:predicted nucleotidyltransferase
VPEDPKRATSGAIFFILDKWYNIFMSMEELKHKIIPILRANNVEYAAVFGSVARGDAGPNSDVDILVRFGKDISLLDHIGVAYELQDSLGKKVDLVTERSLSKYLAPVIKKDLQILYGQTARSDLL